MGDDGGIEIFIRVDIYLYPGVWLAGDNREFWVTVEYRYFIILSIEVKWSFKWKLKIYGWSGRCMVAYFDKCQYTLVWRWWNVECGKQIGKKNVIFTWFKDANEYIYIYVAVP